MPELQQVISGCTHLLGVCMMHACGMFMQASVCEQVWVSVLTAHLISISTSKHCIPEDSEQPEALGLKQCQKRIENGYFGGKAVLARCVPLAAPTTTQHSAWCAWWLCVHKRAHSKQHNQSSL